MSLRKCLSNLTNGLVSTPEFELRRKFVNTSTPRSITEKKTGRFIVTNVKFHGAVTTKKSMTSSKITRRSIRHVILLFIGNQSKLRYPRNSEASPGSRCMYWKRSKLSGFWGFFGGWWCYGAAGTMEVKHDPTNSIPKAVKRNLTIGIHASTSMYSICIDSCIYT